jgi:hypothetical protein
MKMSRASQLVFESIHGFRLISGFLCLIKTQYFSDVLMTSLFSLFDASLLPSLQKSMVETIWLNFDLSTRFQIPIGTTTLQYVFFTATLELSVAALPEVFSKVPWMDFVIYQAAVLFPRSCDEGKACWDFILKRVVERVSSLALNALVVIAAANLNYFSSQQALWVLANCT